MIFSSGTSSAPLRPSGSLGRASARSTAARPGRAGGRRPGESESMENSLIISLSRQTALQRELDVIANNVANVNTAGFKSDSAIFSAFLRPSTDPASPGRRPVLDNMSWHNMSQGTIQRTGGPLDVAIDGDGMLVVQTAQGERYTRNGALQLNNL